MPQFNRNTTTLPVRNASADERDTQVDASQPNSGPRASERNDYRDGFVHGRTQSMHDSEHLATYLVARDRAAATRGLALGLSLAALAGGAIAALAYFDLRLDSLTPPAAPVRILTPTAPTESEPANPPAAEDAPTDVAPPQVESEVPAPETPERPAISDDRPLGFPPMGGPYSSDGETQPETVDPTEQSQDESPVSESPASEPTASDVDRSLSMVPAA